MTSGLMRGRVVHGVQDCPFKPAVFMPNAQLISVTIPLSVVSFTNRASGNFVSSVQMLPSDDISEIPVALGAYTAELMAPVIEPSTRASPTTWNVDCG